MRFLGAIIAVLAVGVLAGCSSSDSSATPSPAKSTPTASAVVVPGTVDVTLKEWSINPNVSTVDAGSIKFNVKNAGTSYGHEFVILKTDLAPAALPKKADGSIDEEGEGITSPGEVSDLPVGGQNSATIDLTPGSYLFVCNLIDHQGSTTLLHFTNGMSTPFTVK